MGCERIDIPGGVVFRCGRTRDDGRNCSVCGAWARPYKLCDWKLKGEKAGQTCDRVLCLGCAHKVGADKDLCPPHANLWKKHPKNPANQEG